MRRDGDRDTRDQERDAGSKGNLRSEETDRGTGKKTDGWNRRDSSHDTGVPCKPFTALSPQRAQRTQSPKPEGVFLCALCDLCGVCPVVARRFCCAFTPSAL